MDRGDGGLFKRKTEQLLSQLGVPPHLKGCQYLKTAVVLCTQSMEELEGITKRLYPDIARMHHTAGETVEHAIRHAIEAAWQRGDENVQKKLFGYSRMEGKRPTNLEFIYGLAESSVKCGRKVPVLKVLFRKKSGLPCSNRPAGTRQPAALSVSAAFSVSAALFP